MIVNVKNLNGTSDNSHPAGYSSWIDFWEKKTGRKAYFCSCVGCSSKAAVGAHVKKVYGQNNWYIVPLCMSLIHIWFYYFKKGSDFIKAAKNALMKQNNLDGKYYISSSINELILLGKKIGFYDIKKEQYRSFYSPAKIKEYEDSLKWR